MLARLNDLSGVKETEVDWTGRYFLLWLMPRAREEDVLDRAREILETARPVDERAETIRRGGRWMKKDQTLEMSMEEARVLAQRLSSRAAERAGLPSGPAGRLEEAIRSELEQAFRRGHQDRENPLRRLTRAWPEVVERIVLRVAPAMSDDQRLRVKESLLERGD